MIKPDEFQSPIKIVLYSVSVNGAKYNNYQFTRIVQFLLYKEDAKKVTNTFPSGKGTRERKGG